MTDFKSRPDQNIISELRLAIREERKITLQIVQLINEAHDRRLYAGAGYSTPFEWLTKEFGYSAAAAMRRLDSARALRDVPSIEKKIETGERTDIKERIKTFEMIENKSSREVEVALATAFPEDAPPKSESIRTINEIEVRLQVTLTKLQCAALERVREVASHSKSSNSLSEIIDMLANSYLEKNDPLRREVKPRADLPSSSSECRTKPRILKSSRVENLPQHERSLPFVWHLAERQRCRRGRIARRLLLKVTPHDFAKSGTRLLDCVRSAYRSTLRL